MCVGSKRADLAELSNRVLVNRDYGERGEGRLPQCVQWREISHGVLRLHRASILYHMMIVPKNLGCSHIKKKSMFKMSYRLIAMR